jgi:Icc protein
MPIHLPPISRRRFILRTLAAGAAATLGPGLFAAGKRTNRDLWALLADPHIAANRDEVSRGVQMSAHLEQVSQAVLALPERPGGVFVVGDCAFQSGETGDYSTLSDLLSPMRAGQMPVHLALGNHDNRERFWDALKGEQTLRRPVAEKQTAWVSSPRANWLMLDSLEKTLSTPGLLGSEQLAWLAKTLDANRRKPALVVVHHTPGKKDNVEGLKDTQALFDVIRPRKQVKALVFGHTHNWTVAEDESGIHLINLPPVGYVFRAGRPSGWVSATLANHGMRLELRCVDDHHPAHGQVTQLKWRS